MANCATLNWHKLPITLKELSIETTLRCGQSFRWKKLRNNEWSCALHGRIISLKQDSTHLYYKSTWPSAQLLDLPSTAPVEMDGDLKDDDTKILLQNYLNLEPNLTSYYEYWSSIDSNFKKRAPTFTGVRILRQDAWETLIGFICSSNNNIIRISQMVGNLCINFGQLIGHVDEEAFYDFPTPEALAADGVESHLRELGFGYRAGYISKTAKIITYNKPHGWLQSLCNKEPYSQKPNQDQILSGGREGYREAHNQLLELQGVGPKVADCICLMGLGWCEAVPIDTHVLKIAQRDYKFNNGGNVSLTRSTYDSIGNHFRKLWGTEAGWAHSVLFAAELKVFSQRLVIAKDIARRPVRGKSEKLVFKRDYEMYDSHNKIHEGDLGTQVGNPRTKLVKRRRNL